jgi:hypothetical protein
LDWFASARFIDCFIHQAAYVESFPPLRGSKRSTALTSPMLPSLMVEQREAEILVVHRDLNHEAQVRLDHVVPRGLVPAADPLRQRDLLLYRQEGSLADLLEVDLQVAPVERGGGRLGGLGFF